MDKYNWYWDKNAKIYHKQIGMQYLIREEAAKIINSNPGKVLDLACGPGLLIKKLDLSKSKVIGVDFSNEMLKLAKKGIDNKTKFYKRKIQNHSFKEEFDTVTLINTYMNLPKGKNYFKYISKSLKLNGMFIFDIRNKFNPIMFLGSEKLRNSNIPLNKHSVYELRKELKKSGFKIVDTKWISYNKMAIIPKNRILKILRQTLFFGHKLFFSNKLLAPAILIIARKE